MGWHERTLRTWVELVMGDVVDGSVPSLTTVLGLLRDTFEATSTFHWVDDDGAVCNLLCDPPAGWPTTEEADEWARVKSRHPLVEWFARGQDFRPMTTGRLPTCVASADRIAFLHDLLVPDVWQQLSIPADVGGRSQSAFLLAKSGADFTEDRWRLALQLQPLLMLVDARVAAYAEGRDASTAQSLGLTPREGAVLELVTSGLTASSIGARLACSPRTVNKHLENIYRKVGVRDRVSAVLLLQRQRRARRTARTTALPRPGDALPAGFLLVSAYAEQLSAAQRAG